MMTRITFEVDGQVRFIYDDDAASLVDELGPINVRRASHVEPVHASKTVWVADMGPVGGPVLGPYYTRREALEGERSWLIANEGL